MTTPDFDPYDRMMSFLGNSDPGEIRRIAASPAELERMLTRPCSEPEELEPGTWEATESAAAEFERDDRAEAMIYELLRATPETWEAIKTTARRLFPESESNLMEVLDRYSMETVWESWWNLSDDSRDSEIDE